MRRVSCCALLSICAVLGATATPARAQCDPNWQLPVGVSGPNNTVYCALAVDEPSVIGPAVYVGGQFSTAGGVTVNNIGRWSGTAWSALTTGTQSTGTVYALAAKDGLLYVGGGFASMGGQPSTRGLAKWDGTAWSTVGGSMAASNSGPRALAFWGSDLYCGGYQNDMGGVTLHKLGRWNGTVWAPLPGDPIGSTDNVLAVAVYDDGGGSDLYVGGTFASAGGNSYNRNIFRWDGTSLTALGRGANDAVEAMAVWNGSLYVGGYFTHVYQSDGTDVAANKIARWDGTSWHAGGTSAMGTSSGIHVWALDVFNAGSGDALYAGGSFTTVDGATIRYLARWNGTAWGAVGASNFNGYIYALITSRYDGGLYAGGTFTTAGTPSANRIVRWAGARPVSPVNAAATPAVIGVGESSTLSASVAGSTIYWYTGGCGTMLVGTGNSLAVSPTATTTYYAQAFNGTCYSYACDDVTVTVNCAPPTPTNAAATPPVITLGESTTLSASVSGATIYWYTGSCGGTLVGTGDTLDVAPSVTTTYYARAYSGTCFSDGCDDVTVTVNCAPPTPMNAAATPAAITLGDSSTLTASVSGATIYWYTGGCGTTQVGTGDSLVVTPTVTTTYYARAYNGTCFSDACGSATITVNCAPPTPDNAAATPPEITLGESSTLSASVANATIYWYTGGCGTTLAGAGNSLDVTPSVTTTYYARAYNGTCFSDTCASVTVTVNCVLPTITQQPAGGIICAGHSLQMCVVASGNGTLHYQWKRGTLALIGATAPCYTATQAGSYTCIVTDNCGPRVSDVAPVYLATPQTGDLDGNGHVDMDDFARLVGCFAGPGYGLPAGCECVDVVPDGQIDLADFAAFQALYTN